MKMQLMLKYFTSLFICLACFSLSAQDITENASLDSVAYKQKYGLRLGADLSRLVRSFVNDHYKGFELVGDYRISKRFYLAGELGTEERTTEEDLFRFTTKGSYFRAGFDYNTYENWYGMENSIYGGLRLGASTFSQNLLEYQVFNSNPYWNETNQQGTNTNVLGEHSGLSALWLEMVLGLKAELFNNLYVGASIRFNYLLSDKAADNFPNLWIPGFNKVTDDSNFGVGFNYTLSYLIPFYKKGNTK